MRKQRGREAVRQGGRLLLTILFAAGAAAAHAGEEAPAGPLKSVLVELDGSASNDPDGDTLQYQWKQVGGPPVQLSDPHAIKPYFRTATPGTYVFELVVSDGEVESEPVPVTVTVKMRNTPPVAKLPDEVIVEAGQRAVVDGSASYDPEGQPLEYHWRQVAGPPLYLREEDLQGAKLSFASDTPGVWEVELVVSDGDLESPAARCRVVVRPANRRPVARAAAVNEIEITADTEPKQVRAGRRPVAHIEPVGFAQVGAEVVLDGRASVSPGGEKLTYYWKQKGGPFIRSFDRREPAVLRFTPPEMGEYIFELVVSDGERDSAPARTTVRVVQGNHPPVAVAEAPKRAETGKAVRLDGSKSYDREGAQLQYRWRQVAGPSVRSFALTEKGSASPAFIPPEPGRYAFELVVSDGAKESKPAVVRIQVVQGNRRPVAKVGGNLNVQPGETAVLQGTAKDPDGDTLTYQWRQVGGPPLLRAPARQQSITITPREEGRYVFEFIAFDGKNQSLPVATVVEVRRGP